MGNSSSGLPGWSKSRKVDDDFCMGVVAVHALNKSECEAQGLPCDCAHLIKDTWTEIGNLGMMEVVIVCISQFITLMNLTLLLGKNIINKGRRTAPEMQEPDKVNRKSLYYKVQFRSLVLQNIVFVANIIIQFFLMFTTLEGAQKASYTVIDGNCTNDKGDEVFDAELYALYDIRIYGVAGIMLTLFAMILNVKLSFDVYYGTLKKPTLSIVQVVMVGFVLTIAILKFTLCTLLVNADLDSLFAAIPGKAVDGIAWSVKSYEFDKTDVIHSTCDLIYEASS